jgi:hypothetical protein
MCNNKENKSGGEEKEKKRLGQAAPRPVEKGMCLEALKRKY